MLVVEQEAVLLLARIAEAAGIQKHLNHLGHATDEVVVAQLLDVALGERVDQVEVGMLQRLQHRFVACGQQILVESHGVDEEMVDFPHGEGNASVEGNAQKRPGSDERRFRTALGEGLQGGKSAGALLDFVENDKRFRVFGVDARVQAHGVEQSRGSQFAIELPPHGLVFEEVHIGYVVEVGAAKFFDEPGFSHLPRALHEQRTTTRRVFPGDEVLHGESFHGQVSFPLLEDYHGHRHFTGRNEIFHLKIGTNANFSDVKVVQMPIFPT